MNNFDGMDEPVMVSAVGKKRKPSKSNHVREEIKKMRHSGGGKMSAVSCSHKKATNFCHADTLTPGDLLKNFVFLLCIYQNRAGSSHFTADHCQKSSAATSKG